MIWIEILARGQGVAERHRCDGPEVTLGRAYDNDVVLDDPFVAPHHLRIARTDDGRLVAHDLGSVNGLYVGDDAHRQPEVQLDGDRTLRIGRTLVRVRDPAFPVPPERTVLPTRRTWPAALALCGVVAAVSLLSLWLAETSEPQLSRYVLPLIGMALIVLVWTTAWALMGRIFSGQARFERHLAIAMCGLLAFFVFDEITDYGAFGLSWRAPAEYAYAGNWLLLGALCFFHLREIGPLRLRLKGGVEAALALAAIGAQTLTKSELSSMLGQQSYLPVLKPPVFRLKAPKSGDAFFADAERLKAAVDKARKDPVEGPGLLPDMNDDN